MLIIPTYISSSSIHGLGLFTGIDIKIDTIIWKLDEREVQRFTNDEHKKLYNDMSTENKERLDKWTYQKNGKMWITYNDNFKFCNHSDNNFSIKGIKDINNSTDEIKTVISVRDIKANEELLVNYNDFY